MTNRVALSHGRSRSLALRGSGVLLSMLLCGPLTAQAPAGYILGPASVTPDAPTQYLAGKRFWIHVERVAATPEQRALILTAERLYPAHEVLLRAARTPDERVAIEQLDSIPARGSYLTLGTFPPRLPGDPEFRWWWRHFDGTFEPYALTGAAVDYYAKRIHDIAEGRGPFPPAKGKKAGDTGSFSYIASVRPVMGEAGAFVVTLTLSWEYLCGPLCAMWVSHRRSVWFDAEGKVIRVSGDGIPEVTVS